MDGMQINDIRVFFTNCDKYARGELVVERKMKKDFPAENEDCLWLNESSRGEGGKTPTKRTKQKD
jgi:hypothetical protein